MVLYLIGLGLCDEKDITVRGLEAIKKCSHVYLEGYTSILSVDVENLEKLYSKKIIIADREMMESNAEEILDHAVEEDVAMLVVGDVFGATTHYDFYTRALNRSIKVEVIHNTTILTAVSACGLQLYSYGQTISIPFFSETWRPDSFYDKIVFNKSGGLHTLCLLDIKVKEQSIENLLKRRKIYEPPRYMTVNQAIEQLFEVEEKKQKKICTPDTLAVGLARVGTETQLIKSGTLSELKEVDFGGPLHCLIIVGDLQETEKEYLEIWK
ncbi:diphthine synthase [Anaeramoeba flamelloides]|uniref:diphthine methyl ester synthase n=1 Tax=Anaeramoeba flamelloides TaxID=1746091 RepID=A0AAV7Z7N5_9EUKA|nr:diphthine synthase [Anaeramoeba flamelloides]KAJ6240797.1 diphthine synthase [Anaeramoeba flamelloides]